MKNQKLKLVLIALAAILVTYFSQPPVISSL